MNILFFDPTVSRHEYNEPYGLEVLATYIMRLFKKVNVKILSLAKDGMLCEDAFENNDLIGISLTFNSLEVLSELYKTYIRSKKRGVLVLGNSLATFAFNELLNKYREAVCCIGEGEPFYRDLIPLLQRRDFRYLNVANAAFWFNDCIHVNHREVLSASELVTPSIHANNNIGCFVKRNSGTFRVEGSRGCSWSRCSFCYIHHKYCFSGRREFLISDVIDRIKDLSDFGVKNPYFTDDDFIGNNFDRVNQLCKQIINLKQEHVIAPDMKFFVSIKATDVLNSNWKKISSSLFAAGFEQLFVGIESGCDSQLRRYGKGISAQAARHALFLLQRQHFSLDIGFIFFDPFLTYNELLENLSFIEDNHLYSYRGDLFDYLRVTPYTPFSADNNFSCELDVNMLSYYYGFKDTRVAKISFCFSEWKQRTQKYVWDVELQNRGDSANLYAYDCLRVLNYVEFLIMKSIAQQYSTESRLDSPLNSETQALFNLYESNYFSMKRVFDWNNLKPEITS